MGEKYEGRYFFSSVESLTASYTCLEKHYLKCSKTPPDVKNEVIKTRSRHPAQRKALKVGSQQAYFNELWDRFKKTKSSSLGSSTTFSSFHIRTSRSWTEGQDPQPLHALQPDTEASSLEEFSDHIRLLSVLHKSATDDDSDLLVAFQRYYGCLEYFGRTYMTPEMPRKFSASWLLAKVQPKDYSDKSL